eukprot:707061-Amorphochlora_amoeboformis.AAC.1
MSSSGHRASSTRRNATGSLTEGQSVGSRVITTMTIFAKPEYTLSRREYLWTGAESKERTLHFSDKVQIDRLQKLQQDLKRSEEVLRKLRGILVGKLEKLEGGMEIGDGLWGRGGGRGILDPFLVLANHNPITSILT